MKKIEEKALLFVTAISDVYREEENRGIEAFPPLDMTGDFTDDLTAILLAAKVVCEELIGYDGDLIDFTHVLNKLAVQYVMDCQSETEDLEGRDG